MLDDPSPPLDEADDAGGPSLVAVRRGPPGEWGGRPRLTLLAMLAAAAVGAVVVVASSRSSPRKTVPPVARPVAALPKPFTVPIRPIVPLTNDDALVARLAHRGARVYCGAAHDHEVALTFDDGPGPQTIKILRILTQARVAATFFLIGRNVQARPKLAELEVSLGMAVGDHTQTHPDLTLMSRAQITGELVDARAAIVAATGRPVTLFRPPYGARTALVDAQARALGLLEVLWDVDTRDSERAKPATILANARRGLRSGSIVLMHEDSTTVTALPAILHSLRARKLDPVTIPQLVAGGHRTRTCPYIPATE